MSSSQPAAPQETSSSQIGMWDAVSIIVGIIIGATIFESPPDIFNAMPEKWTIANHTYTISAAWTGLGAWLLVGILSLIGALCYAELGTTFPTTGGDYTYISRAYGHGPGFLFAWAEMSIIRTGGSITIMAYVFATYAERLLKTVNPSALESLGSHSRLILAGSPIILLTLVNALGLKPGKWTQNLLVFVKVVGLLAIIVSGFLFFLWPTKADQVVQKESFGWEHPSYALALVFLFYAYGGWNEAAYVAGELRNRRRNMILALMIGVGAVTLIYLAVNGAYLAALGLNRVRASDAIAADVMTLSLGSRGAMAISILILISTLGAINGLLFCGIRLYSNFGEHERLFAWLSRKTFGSVPLGALLIQTFFSLGLILLFETTDFWKPWLAEKLNVILPYFNMNLPENFTKKPDGFRDVVACTAPVFWWFFTLSGFALIVLRSREPERERPFRVPLYPILPIIFCLSSLFMLYKSTDYAITKGPAEIMVVLVFLLLGIPLYAFSGPVSAKSRPI
jgi:amino acid transporter